MMYQMGWYRISRVRRTKTELLVQEGVDAVFADSFEEACTIADTRNYRRPWEVFGATKARGIIGINQCVACHNRRTAQIEELKQLIKRIEEQHV